MKKARTVASRIFAAISVVIFLFGLFVFVSVMNASAGKVPTVLGYSFLQIQTGSMKPEYEVGAVIVTRKTDIEKLKVGDVISFYATQGAISGQVNTHRIVEINKNMAGKKQFVTKGDANALNDPAAVSSVSVIGKVVYNLGTVSGSVISVLQNPKIIFFLIVLPLIFITMGEAINLAKLIAESKFGKDDENNDGSQDAKS